MSSLGKRVQTHRGQTKEARDALEATEAGRTALENMCTADAVVRYPKTSEYPEEMWGKAMLDDFGQRMYKPCGNKALKGQNICQIHGGTLPVVRKSAEELLAACRDRLMFELLRMALDETKDDRLRFDAMKWGLERAGFQAGVTVSLGIKPWQEALQAIKESLGGESGE